MNNLLFYTLLILLIYYFFYYLPQQKKLTKNQALEAELKTKNKDYQSQITQLQTQIRELVKRPLKPTNSQSTQTDDESLANTLDHLIKDIQALNNSL